MNRFIWDKIVRSGSVTVDPGINYQVGFEPSKIQNIWRDYVYRSAAGTKNANLDFTQDGVTSISTEACTLWGLNLTSSYQTLKLQKWTGSWVDIGNFEYNATKGCAVIFYEAVSSVKYRVVMADTNVESYVQLGAAHLGEYEEISRGWEYGASYDVEDTAEQAYSKAGYISTASGYQRYVRGVTYVVLQADEAKLEKLYNQVGKEHTFSLVLDSDDPENTMEYCIFLETFKRKQPENLFTEVSLVWEAGVK